MKAERKIDDEVLLQMDKEGKSLKEIAEHFHCSKVAVWKRMQRLKPGPADNILEDSGLTDPQKKFALAKAGGATNTQAVLASYEVTSMDSAKTIGSRLMQNETIRQVIERLMETHGLTRDMRIKKLKSHVENKNPDVSLRAIDMANKLDDSYPDKIQKNMNLNASFNLDGEALPGELAEIIERITEGRH